MSRSMDTPTSDTQCTRSPSPVPMHAACLPLLLAAEGSAWERFQQWLIDHLAPPLKSLQAPLDRWLVSMPDDSGRWAAAALFIVAGISVWMLPRRFIYLGAPDERRWRDLRWWATVTLVPYLIIYTFCFLPK